MSERIFISPGLRPRFSDGVRMQIASDAVERARAAKSAGVVPSPSQFRDLLRHVARQHERGTLVFLALFAPNLIDESAAIEMDRRRTKEILYGKLPTGTLTRAEVAAAESMATAMRVIPPSAEKTDWYSGTIAPARSGVYELNSAAGGREGGWCALWDGSSWHHARANAARAAEESVDAFFGRPQRRNHKMYEWRGFKEQQA